MAQVQTSLTEAEYLVLERAAETKSEFLNGEIFAMAGASRQHNLIVANLMRELGNALLSGPCEAYPSDMRVRVAATGLYTYPDVTVVCDKPHFVDGEFDTLTNPTLLIEVLSKSTADYDRGKKFDHFRSLPSLQEILFVEQSAIHIVQYKKLANGTWNLSETRDPEAELHLSSIDARLGVEGVYAKVELDPVATDLPSGPVLLA